ncbi:MAG: polysaccharide deacetylase family protein [Vicinamibacterales bacterium]
MIWRTAFNALSPAGPRARLSVLLFHRVLASKDALLPSEPDAIEFERHMQWIKRWFNVLPLEESVRRMRAGTLPARALSITFDDGYADNLEVAQPILNRLGIPATIFIASGYLDGGRMWNDTIIESVRRCGLDVLDLAHLGLGVHPLSSIDERRRAINSLLADLKYLRPPHRQEHVRNVAKASRARLPDDLMLTTERLRCLRDRGMSVGAHTRGHPILAKVDAATALSEIADSRAELEKVLDQPVTLFAYPNGRPVTDYTAEHVAMVSRLGFEAAFSTASGAASRHDDGYQLPRFTPWDKRPAKFAARLVRNLARTRIATA